MIRLTITETGRDTLKKEAAVFNRITETFSNVADLKGYLIDRYGKMPEGKNKIYQDKKDGTSIVCGFIYSFWNQDCSHNSKKWFQTDWLSFNNVTYEPFDLKELK